MGVDYDGVGGVGIEVTDDMVEHLIRKGLFTRDEWENDEDECIERLGISFGVAGNRYSGNTTIYLFVDGDNLSEVIDNYPKFVESIYNISGIKLSLDDMKIIEDVLIS